MKKVLAGGFALALVFAVSGCGDSHEAVLKDTIKTMDEITEVCESIKDESSAKAAKPKLEKLAEKMKDIKKRADKLGDPKGDKKEALEKKYKDDLLKSALKMAVAIQKASTVPGGKDAIKPLEEIKNLK
jgi:hypothetical protein